MCIRDRSNLATHAINTGHEFLDITITRYNNDLQYAIYRKPTDVYKRQLGTNISIIFKETWTKGVLMNLLFFFLKLAALFKKRSSYCHETSFTRICT